MLSGEIALKNNHYYYYYVLVCEFYEECGIVDTLLTIYDVALLVSQDSFSTTFLKKCGRGKIFGTTTCLTNEVEGKQGHAPCEILRLAKPHFCVSRISWRLYDCHRVEVNLATLIF